MPILRNYRRTDRVKINLAYNTKEGNPPCELLNSVKFGVLEYWSIGVMIKGRVSFFQHSNTPSLQYSRA
jgi:hypothetical protein